jgi:hypothetical protein
MATKKAPAKKAPAKKAVVAKKVATKKALSRGAVPQADDDDGRGNIPIVRGAPSK